MRRPLKVLIAMIALASTLLLCAGCADEGQIPQVKEATVESPVIGQDGVLRVGVDTSKAPLAGIMGSNKAVVGIDVDTAAAIADSLGLKLSIVDVGSDVEAALNEGKVDIVMGINDSDPGTGYWHSQAYLPTGIAAFSLKEDAPIPSSDAGSTFAAQVSSTSAWAVDNEFGSDVLTSVSMLPEAFDALEAGEVDYVAADAVVGDYAARTLSDDVYISALLLKPSGYCIAVATENTDLQAVITDAINQISSNGILSVIEKKWLGTVLDFANVPLTAGASITTLGSDDVTGEDNNADGAEGAGAEGTGEDTEGTGAEGAASSGDDEDA